MCWMVAIPMAMMAASSAMSSLQANKAAAGQNDLLRRQKMEQIKQMNYKDADLKLEDRQAYDDTVAQMTQNSLQQVRNAGTLRAALGESMLQGNSMDRLERDYSAQFTRQQVGLTEDYQRDYGKILGERLGNYENTKYQVASLDAQMPAVKSVGGVLRSPSSLLGMGMAAGSAWASSSAKGGLNDPTPDKQAPISAAVGTKTGHN
ncbi:MAG: internal virion protein B [Spirochaetia bacterium]|nr:internal virion protein B [Spirochaetia bacterium]